MRDFNYSYLKDIKWDSEILGLVSQIHEYKGRQELYLKQKPAGLDKLTDIAKIQSTEASNKIEGIVTGTLRLKQLFREKTTPKNRNEQEILGYRDVLNTIHERFEYIPLRSSYILQLHRDLYKYSEKSFGGRYKNTQNYIAEVDSEVLFTPLGPSETPRAIDSICESFNRTSDAGEIDPLILIPCFIIDFLCIHPFNDGNDRMSRLLTTLLLYRCGYLVGRYISLESKIEKTKSKYYAVLAQSDRNWHEGNNDPTPFIKYILGIILAAYRELEKRTMLLEDKPSATELVRRAVSERIGKFTKSEIMELVPSLSKSSIENALKQLVDEGLILRHGIGKATFYTRNDR